MIGGGRGAFIGAVHRVAAQMDGKAERFVDNLKANELLTREYRKGFVVPENV